MINKPKLGPHCVKNTTHQKLFVLRNFENFLMKQMPLTKKYQLSLIVRILNFNH